MNNLHYIFFTANETIGTGTIYYEDSIDEARDEIDRRAAEATDEKYWCLTSFQTDFSEGIKSFEDPAQYVEYLFTPPSLTGGDNSLVKVEEEAS